MSNITAEKLNIILTARDREFARAMAANQRRVERFAKNSQRNLSKTSKSFSGLAGAMRGLLPALGAAALISGVKRTLASLDEIGKTADNLGLATSALQELRVVAESSGLEFAEFTKAFQKFTVGIGEANTGTGTARDAFTQMGISIRGANGSLKSSEALFNETAEALKGFSSESDRAAIAADLFGAKVGVKMLNLLRNGADGMAEMRKAARDLGVVIDEDLIRNAEAAQTQLDLMARVISAQLSTALIELAPLLVNSAELVAQLSKGVAGFAAIVATLPTLGATALNVGEDVAAVEALVAAAARFPEAAAQLENLGTKLNDARSQFGQTSSEFNAAAAELKTAQDQLMQRAQDTSPDGNGAPRNINSFLATTLAAIEAQKEKLRLSGLTADAIAREVIAQKKAAIVDEFFTENQRAGLEVTDQGLAGVLALADAYEASAIAALGATTSTGGAARATRDLTQAEIDATAETEAFANAMISLGMSMDEIDALGSDIQSSMENAFMSIADGTETASEAFRSMARDIVKELYRVLVVQQLVGQFQTGGGGILGALAPVFGRAGGGNVQAGQAVTVGESGRELFVPQSAGRVMTAPQVQQGLGGGSTVNVYQTNNFAKDMATIARAEIRAATPYLTQASKAAVLDAQRRGGGFAAEF